MVFLIQHTQDRDTHAVQIKLDELIRAIDGAHNSLLDLEELTEEELDQFKERYEGLAREARRGLKRDCPIQADQLSANLDVVSSDIARTQRKKHWPEYDS